jgi:hypothetical protein
MANLLLLMLEWYEEGYGPMIIVAEGEIKKY